MDNFKAIYKILTALEACMDLNEANIEMFNAKALGITEERWKKYIEMLEDVGRCWIYKRSRHYKIS